MNPRAALRAAMLPVLLLLSSCATSYDWKRMEEVGSTNITKIETPFASTFCSALFGPGRTGCAVRLIAANKCVIVTLPSDTEAIAHESVHCLGFDHTER